MQETQHRFKIAAIRLRAEIPPIEPVSPEELQRRQDVIDRILQRRERIGPIGIRADDLLHAAEAESGR